MESKKELERILYIHTVHIPRVGMWTVEKERSKAVYLSVHSHARALSAIYGYFPLEHSLTPLYSKSLLDAISPGVSSFSAIRNNVSSPDCWLLTVHIPFCSTSLAPLTHKGVFHSPHTVTLSWCLKSVSDSAPPPSQETRKVLLEVSRMCWNCDSQSCSDLQSYP